MEGGEQKELEGIHIDKNPWNLCRLCDICSGLMEKTNKLDSLGLFFVIHWDSLFKRLENRTGEKRSEEIQRFGSEGD